jgi:hypothetical protein
MRIPDELKQCVAFLHVFEGSKYKPIGTGFFLHITEGDLVFCYLVTCKHVVKPYLDNNQEIYMRLNSVVQLDVGYLRVSSGWVFHDDEAIDLAVALVPTDKPTTVGLTAMSAQHVILTKEGLGLSESGQISEGDDVFFIGLFAQYTGYQRNFPVVRFGKIALVTDELVHGEYGLSHYHFVECQAYPGHSGSPLFVIFDIAGSKIVYLLGVVAAFYPHMQQVFVEPQGQEQELYLYTHYGISTVVPVEYVSMILYGEKFMEERKKKVGAGRRADRPQPAGSGISIDDEERNTGGITRGNFLTALRKVSKPVEDQPDEERSET